MLLFHCAVFIVIFWLILQQTASSRRHELGQDYQQSPYYPGKTTFGGAAAHRKNRLKHSSPYHVSIPMFLNWQWLLVGPGW